MRTIRSGYVAAGLSRRQFWHSRLFRRRGPRSSISPCTTTFAPPDRSRTPTSSDHSSFRRSSWMLQDVLLGRERWPLAALTPMLMMLSRVLLSFSRGAWGAPALDPLLAVLTFRDDDLAAACGDASSSSRSRARCLRSSRSRSRYRSPRSATSSSSAPRSARITTSASWADSARSCGRFRCCSSVRSASAPAVPTIFPSAPHNVYLNAFASYGWLGGVCFLALTVVTVYVGWRLVFRRSPMRDRRHRRLVEPLAADDRRDSRSTPIIGAICICCSDAFMAWRSAATIDEHEERNAQGRGTPKRGRRSGRRTSRERFGAISL